MPVADKWPDPSNQNFQGPYCTVLYTKDNTFQKLGNEGGGVILKEGNTE